MHVCFYICVLGLMLSDYTTRLCAFINITDITRTVHMGTPSSYQVSRRVLYYVHCKSSCSCFFLLLFSVLCEMYDVSLSAFCLVSTFVAPLCTIALFYATLLYSTVGSLFSLCFSPHTFSLLFFSSSFYSFL
jgi:hypothetical protein